MNDFLNKPLVNHHFSIFDYNYVFSVSIWRLLQKMLKIDIFQTFDLSINLIKQTFWKIFPPVKFG